MKNESHLRFKAQEYGFSFAVVAVATGISFAMFPYFELTNLAMVYLLGTLIVASRGSKGAAAFSSFLGVLCFDFFFVPTRFTLRVNDVQYILTFIVMFAVAMIISHLTIRLRSEAEVARQSQRTTKLMHEFSTQLFNTRNLDDVLHVAVTEVAKTFSNDVTICLPVKNGRLEIKAASDGTATLSEKDRGVAHWVHETGQPAGMGTDSLPQTDALYIPLPGSEGSVGVLSVTPRVKGEVLDSEQRKLLDSFAHQVGMALEVDRLQETARRAELEIETERLRNSLLSSVSHDFRTPLTAIVGSASTLLSREENKNNPRSLPLLETIHEEGQRLSRLVQNLLEITRLESGNVTARKELCPLEEVLGSSMDRLENILNGRKINVDIPGDFPPIPMDELLMEQVFMNLLENAVRHTPPTSRIEISARLEGSRVVVSVGDNGPGLKETEHVFDKFTRDPASPGVGLGLAICRGIVNAHGGRIWAENSPNGGAVFHFTLPKDESHG